jgi:hypothetical protein
MSTPKVAPVKEVMLLLTRLRNLLPSSLKLSRLLSRLRKLLLSPDGGGSRSVAGYGGWATRWQERGKVWWLDDEVRT